MLPYDRLFPLRPEDTLPVRFSVNPVSRLRSEPWVALLLLEKDERSREKEEELV